MWFEAIVDLLFTNKIKNKTLQQLTEKEGVSFVFRFRVVYLSMKKRYLMAPIQLGRPLFSSLTFYHYCCPSNVGLSNVTIVSLL